MFSITYAPVKSDLRLNQVLLPHLHRGEWNGQFLGRFVSATWEYAERRHHGRGNPRMAPLSSDVLHVGTMASQPGAVGSTKATPVHKVQPDLAYGWFV